MKVEALHEFHDEEFSQGWADRFVPSPPKIALFDMILSNIGDSKSRNLHVVELGIGPGYLAKHVLERRKDLTYEGLDFSIPMLNIARKRLDEFEGQITFTQTDLTSQDWGNKLSKPADVVVSTWALHDLFNKDNILHVYKAIYELLPKQGVLLNGDFIKPETSPFEYEGGRIKPSEHLDLLKQAGFSSVACLEEFEKNISTPTSANNYACFKAVK